MREKIYKRYLLQLEIVVILLIQMLQKQIREINVLSVMKIVLLVAEIDVMIVLAVRKDLYLMALVLHLNVKKILI